MGAEMTREAEKDALSWGRQRVTGAAEPHPHPRHHPHQLGGGTETLMEKEGMRGKELGEDWRGRRICCV